MLPPGAYERIAREAEKHLQLRIESVELHGDTARVAGPVLRVFRGAQELLNSSLAVLVPVVVPGADHPPSGVTRTRPEELAVGKVLEGYFADASDGCRAILGLVMTLDEPTDTPRHYLATLPVESAAKPARGYVRWLVPIALGVLAVYVAIRLLSS